MLQVSPNSGCRTILLANRPMQVFIIECEEAIWFCVFLSQYIYFQNRSNLGYYSALIIKQGTRNTRAVAQKVITGDG